MGAWSHTSFGNDDASDFIYEVEEQGETAIASVLEAVNQLGPDDYLEAPQASAAIAAAELVAAAAGKPPVEFPEQAAVVVSGITDPARLRGAALKAVTRVLGNSELHDLWADADDFDKWRAEVEGLIERLK